MTAVPDVAFLILTCISTGLEIIIEFPQKKTQKQKKTVSFIR